MGFRYIQGLCVFLVVLFFSLADAADTKSAHMDKRIMSDGCASCHLGFNRKGWHP